MRRRNWLALACLVPLSLRAEILGIELVGLGPEGPSASYAAGDTTVVRFRLLDREPQGDPVNVVIRRDDGFLKVVAGVTERDTVLSVEVPLKGAAWTVNEFTAYVFDPGSGQILESVGSRTLIGTGRDSAAPALAATLESSRARIREDAVAAALAALDSEERPAAEDDAVIPRDAASPEAVDPEVAADQDQGLEVPPTQVPAIPLVRPVPVGVLAVSRLEDLLGNAL